MRQGSLCAWIATFVVAVGGCAAGNGSEGSVCTRDGDCGKSLQCLNDVCQPFCSRSPQCGDGYACAADGECEVSTKYEGEPCSAEPQCGKDLSCQLDGSAIDPSTMRLAATCSKNLDGNPAGTECTGDKDCRNGTCALGHCVDLCESAVDCVPGDSCTEIPRVEAPGALFQGCLPSTGEIAWSIPVRSQEADVLVPVPVGARSLTLVMSVDDDAESVGAETLTAPDGTTLYETPCDPMVCGETDARDAYYSNLVRHSPALGMSVLELPSSPHILASDDAPLPYGLYEARVSSFSNGETGASTPHLTAITKLDAGSTLALHFYFLDLDEHPCAAKTGNQPLTSVTAQSEAYFQSDYLGSLRSILRGAGITIGDITYDPLVAPELDGLDIADAGALFARGTYATGINIFFVRSLSPAGLQAYGPNPGPAGMPGTVQSGIAISLDTLCYRDWAPNAMTGASVSRITAHEIARYLGLYHNVEPEYALGDHMADDGIDDDDMTADNLMFYSELGGTTLSPGQRAILARSPVLK